MLNICKVQLQPEINRATEQLPHSINLIFETIPVLIFKYYTIENGFYYLYIFCNNLGIIAIQKLKMEQQQIQQLAIYLEISSNLYCWAYDFR